MQSVSHCSTRGQGTASQTQLLPFDKFSLSRHRGRRMRIPHVWLPRWWSTRGTATSFPGLFSAEERKGGKSPSSPRRRKALGTRLEARTFSQLWKAGLGLILSLTSVSLERLSATLWPLRLMNIWLRNASSQSTFWTKPGVLSVSVTWFQ